MIEKVNPSHPDKIADRIAGAIVDLAYKKNDNPKIAVEVLIGHDECNIIIETSEAFTLSEISAIVKRIAGDDIVLNLNVVPQDIELAKNQEKEIRCGDNGIFVGMPITAEQQTLSDIARDIYSKYPTDGKYILDLKNKLIICQSNAKNEELAKEYESKLIETVINPLGEWAGGINVDTGATNRKLGSDMADAVTGGGLHGKDLSKADVSINIYAHLKAKELGRPVKMYCAIGDKEVNGIPFSEIVEVARKYINDLGGFEKLAEWGLF